MFTLGLVVAGVVIGGWLAVRARWSAQARLRRRALERLRETI